MENWEILGDIFMTQGRVRRDGGSSLQDPLYMQVLLTLQLALCCRPEELRGESPCSDFH